MRKLSLLIIALALLIAPARSNAQAAFNLDKDTLNITATGQSVIYFNLKGVLNYSIEEIFSGGPASATVTITGCMWGGTCKTMDVYTGTANSIRSFTGLFTSITFTATLSGGTSPAVKLNLDASAASSPSILSYAYINITSNTSTQIKSGPGFLHQVVISTKGATGNTLKLFDNTACSGAAIATIDTTAGVDHLYDVQFNTGLCALSATGTAGDFTISFI